MNGNFKHLNNIIHSTQSSFFLRFVHMFVKYIKYVNNYLLLCDFLITDLNFISVSFKLQKLCILRYIYIIIKNISMCVWVLLFLVLFECVKPSRKFLQVNESVIVFRNKLVVLLHHVLVDP